MWTGLVFWVALAIGFWLRGTELGTTAASYLKRDDKPAN